MEFPFILLSYANLAYFIICAVRLKEKLFSVPVTVSAIMSQYSYVMVLDVATGKRRVQPVRFPIPGMVERYLKYRMLKCVGELPRSFKEEPKPSSSTKPVARVAPRVRASIRPELVTYELSDWGSDQGSSQDEGLAAALEYWND